MPKNSTYYKDKATQTAALRVTNNSHFQISFKGHSSTRIVLTHNAVYLQTISLPYNRSAIYVSFASLCFDDKIYEPKT